MSSGEMSFVRCLPQGFEIHFCEVIPSGVVFLYVFSYTYRCNLFPPF